MFKMKPLICISFLIHLSIFPMELAELKKNNDSPVIKCYLAQCPQDICNIIAQMLEWQPHAFKRFVPETDGELIQRASLKLNNTEYWASIQEKNKATDYPGYKTGRLTVKEQPVLWPTHLFGFKVFALIAHKSATHKHLICAYGKHYLYTKKRVTASPNNTKILWVEEEETYHKNALLILIALIFMIWLLINVLFLKRSIDTL